MIFHRWKIHQFANLSEIKRNSFRWRYSRCFVTKDRCVCVYMCVCIYVYIRMYIYCIENYRLESGWKYGVSRNYGRFVAASSSEKFIPLERSMTLIAGVEALHWSVSYESGCFSGVGSLTSAFTARGLIDTGIIEIIDIVSIFEGNQRTYPRMFLEWQTLDPWYSRVWKINLEYEWVDKFFFLRDKY